MNIYTIVLPTYNDWKSLSILLIQIEKYLKNTKNTYKILIIDDNSSEKNKYRLNKNKFFKEIKILRLKALSQESFLQWLRCQMLRMQLQLN